MPETPETESRITKIQKDVEELKEFMRDTLHDRRDIYEKRVGDILRKYPDCVTLWLEIDGIRSLNEIEKIMKSAGHTIPHVTFWRSAKRLFKAGLISKVAVKSKSPVYSKKMWNEELNIDEYVRKMFVEQKTNNAQD